MTETQTETDIAKTATQPAETQVAVTVPKTDKVRTRGWKLFDFLVHWVNNYAGNIAMSLWITNDGFNYRRNQAIDKFKETNGAEGFDGEKRKTTWGFVHKIGDSFDKNVSSKFWNWVAGDKHQRLNESDKNDYKGYTNSVFVLGFGGHITTAIAYIFERPAIKKPLVRFLDKVIDTFAGKPSEEKLAERKEIYNKLDTELSGKTLLGMIGSRAFGMATIILILIGAKKIDKAVSPEGTADSELGLNRAAKKMKSAGSWMNQKIFGGKLLKNHFEEMSDGYEYKGKDYKKHMVGEAAVEFLGTSVTSTVQFFYIMSKELFGFGVDTNIKDKSAKESKANDPIAVTKQENTTTAKTTSPEMAEEKAPAANKPVIRFAEKTKPAGETYVDKKTAAESTNLEHAQVM